MFRCIAVLVFFIACEKHTLDKYTNRASDVCEVHTQKKFQFNIKLFDILSLAMPALKPEECKVHLASWNKRDEPRDLFLAGDFAAWQKWQGHKNFGRAYIVSLIKLDDSSRWLFAGVHATHGCRPIACQQDKPWNKKTEYRPTGKKQTIKQAFHYETNELPQFGQLTGRLIVSFSRPGRQPYLKAEKWVEQMQVNELMPRRLEIEEFPGFSRVLLRKSDLDLIVQQEIVSWKSALASVAGVYLITDSESGRHYVGSAYGQGGIWGRWKTYSKTGHGFNKLLQGLLEKWGTEYARNFQFSILETADTNSTKKDVLIRETHWKNVLCSHERYGGYN